MDLSRIDQAVSEFTFYLYNRPMHPELFQIYAERKFSQGDYEVHLWLTGCSHVLSVFHGSHCITELICTTGQMLPKRGLIRKMPFRSEKSHKCSWAQDFTYMMNFQVETTKPKLYQHIHQDLTEMGQRRGLFVSFDKWARSDVAPFSFLDYEAHHDELHVHAYHAFPEQHTILKSQSLFNVAKTIPEKS